MKRAGSMLVILSLALAASPLWADAPAGQYTVAADTVKDNKTGLTWQRTVPAQTYAQPNAATYCQRLNLGGFSSGWRLPSKLELETILGSTQDESDHRCDGLPEYPVRVVLDLHAFGWQRRQRVWHRLRPWLFEPLGHDEKLQGSLRALRTRRKPLAHARR